MLISFEITIRIRVLENKIVLNFNERIDVKKMFREIISLNVILKYKWQITASMEILWNCFFIKKKLCPRPCYKKLRLSLFLVFVKVKSKLFFWKINYKVTYESHYILVCLGFTENNVNFSIHSHKISKNIRSMQKTELSYFSNYFERFVCDSAELQNSPHHRKSLITSKN